MYTIFLLSPASCNGKRARALIEGRSAGPLGPRLDRPEGAPLGEVFTFISSLYFRGKLEYAEAFASPPAGVAGVHVITATRGLLSPRARVDRGTLTDFSAGSIDACLPGFRDPLVRSAGELARGLAGGSRVVLLGSVASDKYLDPLWEAFGDRVFFPREFVGRGDMSRGGLMLRAVDADRELAYVRARGAERTGRRPAKLRPRGV